LVDAIPGGSDLWDRVQFHRFDVYGAQLKQTGGEGGPSYSSSAWPWLQVNLRNDLNGSYFGDIASFYDDAVGNSRRSHVGIIPNDLFKSAWFSSDLASPILEFSTDAKDTETAIDANIYEVLIQYSCSLRSTPGVTFEPVTATVTPVQKRHLAPTDNTDKDLSAPQGYKYCEAPDDTMRGPHDCRRTVVESRTTTNSEMSVVSN
jgi:hypothetical protein